MEKRVVGKEGHEVRGKETWDAEGAGGDRPPHGEGSRQRWAGQPGHRMGSHGAEAGTGGRERLSRLTWAPAWLCAIKAGRA